MENLKNMLMPCQREGHRAGRKNETDEKSFNLYELTKREWSPGRDLNPRPPPYQGGDLTGLSYQGFRGRNTARKLR